MAAAIPDEIRALSDEELVALAGTLNGGAGCLVWSVVPLVTLGVGVLYGAPLAFLSAIAAAFACRFVDRLRERLPSVRRARLAQQEFGTRYGATSFKHALAEAGERLEAVEAVILLEVVGLPHGGYDSFRVELGEDPRVVIHSTPFVADLLADFAANRERVVRLDQPLPEAVAEQLEALILPLTAAEAVPEQDLLAMGVDGARSRLHVLRRQAPPFELRFELFNAGSEEETHPAFRLAKLLFALKAELVRPRTRRVH